MIRILTDTASDFDLEEAASLGITVIPMEITIGDQSYRDRYDITPDRFYELLIESSELPHTSQINSYTFEQEFEKIHEAGDSAVVILMSSKLSGTYQNAVIAAQDYDEIRVVDSRNGSIGEQILVRYMIWCTGWKSGAIRSVSWHCWILWNMSRRAEEWVQRQLHSEHFCPSSRS